METEEESMKKRNFKKFSLLLIITLLAGCGSGTGTNGKESTTGEAAAKAEGAADGKIRKEPVKIVLWGGVPEENGCGDVVAAWNAANPDVQVEFVRYQNDDTGIAKLDTALLSGEQIDLFFSYYVNNLEARHSSGILENLEPYGAKEFAEEELVGGLESCVMIEGSLYALPTMFEPFGLMVNQAMLDEAGITIPDQWTLAEFEEINRKLTKEDEKKVYGSALFYTYLPMNVPQSVLGADYLYKAGGTESNFDHPIFIETNRKIKEMMDEGIAMSYDEIFARTLNDSAHAAFLNGEVAMIPYTSWMLRNVKNLKDYPHDFKTTFVPLPTSDDGMENPYRGIFNGWLSINSESKYKEECWEFIKFWITEGSRTMTLKGGKITAWNKISDEEAIHMTLGEQAATLFDVEAYKNTAYNPKMKYLVSEYTAANQELISIYREESEKYFLGGLSDEDYINNLKSRGDKAISGALN